MSDADNAAVLQLDANLTRLEKAFKKANSTSDQEMSAIERRAKRMADKVEETTGKIKVSEALEKVFDSSKLKILDEGAARINVFGSALEPLGPTGIAAAAGIAAIGEAFAQSKEAIEYAHNIAKAAEKVHTTTDALQELRFAIKAAGGEESGADTALEAFSVTLGKASAGVSKSLRPFKELFGDSFTAADVKKFKDADAALEAITERMQGLSSTQKDAIVDQLGLTGIKPLIESGVDKMRELREEAKKVGVVMDAELVKRGAEAQEKFETVSKVIDVQLKSALVDLAPILVGLLGIMGSMATAAADIADGFRSVGDRSTRGLEQRQADLDKQIKTGKYDPTHAGNTLAGDLVDKLFEKDTTPLIKERDEIAAELAKRKAAEKPPAIPTTSLTDVTHTGNGPRDDSAQRGESIAGAQAGAHRAVLQAMLSLTTDIEARASIEKQIVDAELAQKNAGFARQAIEINADKGISNAKKAELVSELKVVASTEKKAADLRKEEIDRKAAQDLIAQNAANDKEISDLGDQYLQTLAGVVKTLKQRRDIEGQLLLNRQAEARADLERKIATPGYTGNAEAERGGLDLVQGAERRANDQANEGPLKRYADGIRDVDTAMQNAEVGSIQSLNSTLADLAVKGGDAKNSLHSLAQQVEVDFAKIGLQQLENSAIKLLGFDGGGYTGPGVRAAGLDGKGGFMAMLHPHETVIDHTITPRNVRSSGGAMAVVAGPTFNLQGAVVVQDLLNQMNAISARNANAAESRAVVKTLGAQSGYGALQAAEKG